MRVLVAVDDSGFAEDLLRAVVAGIRHENTEVLVLHVLQPVDTVAPPEMAQGYAPELEDEKQPARALVEQIAAELSRAGFTAKTEVRIGTPICRHLLQRMDRWLIGPALAWELIQMFLKARFSGAIRHQRRVDKVSALEIQPVAE